MHSCAVTLITTAGEMFHELTFFQEMPRSDEALCNEIHRKRFWKDGGRLPIGRRGAGSLLRSPFVLDPRALYVATVPHIHTHDLAWSDKQRHPNTKPVLKGCVLPGAILL
jgi:hypothetical protein